MESMRVKGVGTHLTLVPGGATSARRTATPQTTAGRPRPVMPLRLVRSEPRTLSPGAESLLRWLDTASYAGTPDAALQDGVDLLRVDVATRLLHDARAARGQVRAGEAS